MKNNENKDQRRIQTISVKPEMKIKIMNDQELEQIQQATLTVLQEAGIKFPSERALNIFAEAGAEVDFKKQIVKIQPDLLKNALVKAPRSFCMASRGNDSLDLYLDGTRTYCGTAGTGHAIIDLTTGHKRDSIKMDVATTALVCDYLPEVSFYWPMISARDTPPETMPLHEIEAAFNHTEKHVHIVSCVKERAAQYAVEMATVIAGSKEAARKRPPLSLLVCPISPLSQETGSIEAGLVFAEAGLPVGFAPMPSIGSTGPATIAGTLVTGNAEILSALCLMQLAYPGTPVYYPFFSMSMNPYSGEPVTGSPQEYMFATSVTQLGHYYDLPVLSAYIGFDAKDPWSWQAGVEGSIGVLQVLLTGPDMNIGIGEMDSATVGSHEKILLDVDILKMARCMIEGFTVDTENLAIDDILAVGPMGHFLDTDRTIKNMRKLWQPGLSYEWSPENNTFRDLREVTKEKVQWILDNHIPAPLDAGVKNELERIIRSAERELVR